MAKSMKGGQSSFGLNKTSNKRRSEKNITTTGMGETIKDDVMGLNASNL